MPHRFTAIILLTVFACSMVSCGNSGSSALAKKEDVSTTVQEHVEETSVGKSENDEEDTENVSAQASEEQKTAVDAGGWGNQDHDDSQTTGSYFCNPDEKGAEAYSQSVNLKIQDNEEKKKAAERSDGSGYKSFLEQYEGDVQKACERVPGEYGDKTEIHYFFITDLNSDGVEDLITLEVVNTRYEKIGIYTLDESEVVVPFYFEDGSEALFDDNHQANGGYDFYICSNQHVHNNYYGGMETIEDTYIVDGKTLKHHLRYKDFHDYSTETDHKETISKDGKEISRGEYDTLIANCNYEQFSWTLNDEKGRDSIK